jgi:putative protease
MYGGRAGRDYVTRTHPDNRGRELGVVERVEGRDLVVRVSSPLMPGDGIGFEAPDSLGGASVGFTVGEVRTLGSSDECLSQALLLPPRVSVAAGWRVVRSSEAALLERARASYAALPSAIRQRKTRIDARVFGSAGAPLKAVFKADDETVTVRSDINLAPATRRALDEATMREQFGRLGETPFVLGAVDAAAVPDGLFLPVSELNHLRQQAVDELLQRRDWVRAARLSERRARIDDAIAIQHEEADRLLPTPAPRIVDAAARFDLVASVFSLDDARTAAASGATTVVLDPFLRHPMPPVTRVKALADELRERGVSLRLRTPTVVRPEERRPIQKWLDLGLPIVSGHLGLVAELGREGGDVVADYAVNCFNQHTARELFALGAKRIVLSIELTTDEMIALSAPWEGAGFDVFLYGRPEGMTIEHCVLSAAFDREPTTCRDLCVQKHANVQLTDPAGYHFAVATDSACRNRLLHSRPVEGGEYLPRLWRGGIRNYHLVFNVVGDPVAQVVSGYRAMLEELASSGRSSANTVRPALNHAFTRGHFARAV